LLNAISVLEAAGICRMVLFKKREVKNDEKTSKRGERNKRYGVG
jgi:hypothetical protein